MRIGLMFAGQGAQTVGMGRDLYDQSPAARAIFEEADRALGRPLSELCFAGPLDALTASENCQPAIYAMSVACLAAWREQFDCAPAVCAGLSLGEFAAAHAAGVFSFADGLRLVARRGQLMGEACRATAGAMAAVLNAAPELVREVCAAAAIDVANYNCPGQIVISGTRPGVEQAVKLLQEKGVSRVIMLQVDGAFHSRLMQPAASRFAPLLEEVEWRRPTCPLAQNAVGAVVAEPAAIQANLAAQVTGSVRWEECVGAMLAVGVDRLIEFGPGKILAGFAKRIDRQLPVHNVGSLDDLRQTVAALAAG